MVMPYSIGHMDITWSLSCLDAHTNSRHSGMSNHYNVMIWLDKTTQLEAEATSTGKDVRDLVMNALHPMPGGAPSRSAYRSRSPRQSTAMTTHHGGGMTPPESIPTTPRNSNDMRGLVTTQGMLNDMNGLVAGCELLLGQAKAIRAEVASALRR